MNKYFVFDESNYFKGSFTYLIPLMIKNGFIIHSVIKTQEYISGSLIEVRQAYILYSDSEKSSGINLESLADKNLSHMPL